MRLKVDVYFNEDDIEDMIGGLKVLVGAAMEKAKENKETATFWIPLGTISVSLEENPVGLED